MKLVTTEPAINEKYDAEVVRGLWADVSPWRCVGLLPGSHTPGFPSCLNVIPGQSLSTLGQARVFRAPGDPPPQLGATAQVKGLGQVPTQFMCEASGPLTTLGFYMRVP